jgi:hypothetical protein
VDVQNNNITNRKGPGSSSLFGMLTEVGQLVFNGHSMTENHTEAPRLFYNKHGWCVFTSPFSLGVWMLELHTSAHLHTPLSTYSVQILSVVVLRLFILFFKRILGRKNI